VRGAGRPERRGHDHDRAAHGVDERVHHHRAAVLDDGTTDVDVDDDDGPGNDDHPLATPRGWTRYTGNLGVIVATYLDAILAAHRERAASDRRSRAEVERAANERPDGVRDLAGALRRDGMSVIAEVKRRSPSKGDLNAGLDPAVMAKEYASGGAAAISVLTDGPHFGGSAADLAAARAACDLPVLRKDFTVCETDVLDAKAMGADAVLLIVAALDDAELNAFHALATEIGLAALVEAHDEAEVERALRARAAIIGVNQRDLVTFSVDTDRAVRVAAAIPAGVAKVAESGIRGPGDAARLHHAGYDAVLVGEHLVTSGDPSGAIRELVAACS
jgi:indole-3-glycerol phosphate synthase